ncbi:hypothetical protein ACF0H5_015808 [Mactra antiquata]
MTSRGVCKWRFILKIAGVYICITLGYQLVKLSMNQLKTHANSNYVRASQSFLNQTTTLARVTHRGVTTTGYDRANYLRQACQSAMIHQVGKQVRVSYDPNYKIMYCPLCKLASTFWTRVFKMVELNSMENTNEHLLTPFDVPISKARRSELYYNIQDGSITKYGDAKDSFKFVVVRNPYGTLFSAFVDKLVGPNPFFWRSFGTPATANRKSKVCGSDVTFEEFLRYVVKTHKAKKQQDCHVANFDACHPCGMNYTYVFTMETFKDDTIHILKLFNQTQTLKEFETKFSDYHAHDAIDDSTSGPYSWKPSITKCISWHTALQGIWRKLQIRGVISNNETFPLKEEESMDIGRKGFIKVLSEARKRSGKFDSSKQKKDEYIKMFTQVPVDVLESVREIYLKEFKLFGYDDHPAELFVRA